MAEQSPAAGMITVQQAATLLMLESPRRVQQLASDGWIERAENGRYLIVSVVQGYIRFLKGEKKAGSVGTSENRIRDARSREIELRNAKAENELIEFDESAAVLDEIAGMLRSEFSGFPAAMTRDPIMRKKLEAGINAIFTRAEARIVETVTALAASGEVVEADTEDDA